MEGRGRKEEFFLRPVRPSVLRRARRLGGTGAPIPSEATTRDPTQCPTLSVSPLRRPTRLDSCSVGGTLRRARRSGARGGRSPPSPPPRQPPLPRRTRAGAGGTSTVRTRSRPCFELGRQTQVAPSPPCSPIPSPPLPRWSLQHQKQRYLIAIR